MRFFKRVSADYFAEMMSVVDQGTELLGNKAHKCAVLKNAGFPVPGGYVLTSQFFVDAVGKVARRKAHILEAKAWTLANEKEKNEWRREIGNVFNAEIARLDIAGMLPDKFPPVAVRSSGTSEDSADQSFAGLYETVLGPSDYTSLQDAMVQCLLSAFGDRVTYALTLADENAKIPPMAVFVQELVIAEAAGVCFGPHDDIEFCYISSIDGFGERLVGAEEESSTYIVDVAEQVVVDRKITNQKKKLIYEDNGMVLKEMNASSQTLPDSILLDLLEYTLDAENKFGAPQDIEWVYSEGNLWIVQSRPITKSLSGVIGAGYKDIITREYGVQYCEIAVHSLTEQGSSWVSAHVPSQTWLPERQPNVVAYMKEIESWRMTSDVAKKTNLQSWEKFVSAYNMHAEYYRRTSEMIEVQVEKNPSRESLLDSYRIYQDVAKMYCTFIWQGWAAGDVAVQRLEQVLNRHISDPAAREKLRKFAQTPSKRPISVGQFPDEASSCDLSEESLRDLYKKYYWIPCLDLHHDKYEYDKFVEVVRNHVENPPDKSVESVPFHHLMAPNLNREVEEAIKLLREVLYIKDARDDVRRMGVARVKYTLFEKISSLAKCNVNELSFWTESEIVEFLKSETLPNFEDIRARSNGRFAIFVDKNGCVGCLSGEPANKHAESLPLIFTESRNYPGAAFGIPANTGEVRGRVKIVLSTRDLSKVEDGDILITRTTNAEYLAKMLLAGGVVTDEGNQGSHAAIVCRERGIPCIVNTINGTSMFEDGDQVYLDATNGWIKKEDLL